VAQEHGWEGFFFRANLFPLTITYEQIETDVTSVGKRILSFRGLRKNDAQFSVESIFKKLGDRSSVEWAHRFALEQDARARRSQEE
jgi:LPS sulfotransferase NodH